MATTEDHLKEAFAGESQANRKYLAWAKKAEQDGFANIARLFRTIAEAETIHAHGHLAALGGVGTTAENLKAAIGGETYEYQGDVPADAGRGDQVGQANAPKRMFGYAVEAEAVHARLFQAALEAAAAGKDLSATSFYLCPTCGHVEVGEPPEVCPICGVSGKKFVQV